jgi:hypothetical protein
VGGWPGGAAGEEAEAGGWPGGAAGEEAEVGGGARRRSRSGAGGAALAL